MAFVRDPAGASPSASAPYPPAQARADLASPDPALRWRAARACAGLAGAASALAGRLEREPDSNVRAALFSSLAAIGGPGIAALMMPFLHSDDPALRNGAIETLKHLAQAAAPVIGELLAHPEPDLRLLAIEVTRAWPSQHAAPLLLRIIQHDPHVNVCAAAVDVATELGTPDLLAALAGLRQRFAGQEFIAFAAEVARARIQAPAQPRP